jgi:hypothetical protein
MAVFDESMTEFPDQDEWGEYIRGANLFPVVFFDLTKDPGDPDHRYIVQCFELPRVGQRWDGTDNVDLEVVSVESSPIHITTNDPRSHGRKLVQKTVVKIDLPKKQTTGEKQPGPTVPFKRPPKPD